MSVVTKDVKVRCVGRYPARTKSVLGTHSLGAYHVGLLFMCLGFVECLRCPCYASSAVMAVLPGLAFAGLLVGGGAPALFGGGGGGGDHASRHVGRTLLSSGAQNISWDSQTVIGYILGCISALLYVSSRLPQIIKNVRRGRRRGEGEEGILSNFNC